MDSRSAKASLSPPSKFSRISKLKFIWLFDPLVFLYATMSTIDSDFSPTEIENPSPETVTQMLSKIMKIMKEDKRDNEVRFVRMQEGIKKRMENFVHKFKGSF